MIFALLKNGSTNGWEILNEEMKSLPSVSQFKNKLLLFIRPFKNTSFDMTDIHGIKLLTKLRIAFSDLRYHRFQHNFNCRDPRCICLLEDESNSHFFLRCPHHLPRGKIFLGIISTIVQGDSRQLSFKKQYFPKNYN